MNNKNAHILLNKYWNCETTVAEEQELREFFSGTNVPEELKSYAQLFSYCNHVRSITPGENFDKKLKSALRASKRDSRYITIRVFTPMLRIAATVLLVVGLGLSVLFIAKQYNKPYFAETYHDPNIAIKDATYALIKLSQALQTSEEASLQTIQFIDDLEIDWTSIDSLSNKMFQEIPEEGAILEPANMEEQTNQELKQEGES